LPALVRVSALYAVSLARSILEGRDCVTPSCPMTVSGTLSQLPFARFVAPVAAVLSG